MSSTRVRAAVRVAPNQTELCEFALPEIAPDAGLLRVLAAGICGSDIPAYADMSRGARILGHENVGVIERLGDIARQRWGVSEGVAGGELQDNAIHVTVAPWRQGSADA
jgi:threonine dehydrogenase-like Zn-dependent dehydrogenase